MKVALARMGEFARPWRADTRACAPMGSLAEIVNFLASIVLPILVKTMEFAEP